MKSGVSSRKFVLSQNKVLHTTKFVNFVICVIQGKIVALNGCGGEIEMFNCSMTYSPSNKCTKWATRDDSPGSLVRTMVKSIKTSTAIFKATILLLK